jgi:hypothetical protein
MGARRSEEQQIDFEKTKNSRVVPRELFNDLIAKEGNKLIKDEQGRIQFNSESDLNAFKQRLAAKKALLNPNVLLYPYEFPNAFGEISFFFEADTAIDYTFFLIDANTNEQIVIASGTCRVGGQKVPFDTKKLPNGTYYYGIETKFQRIEKKLRITN